MPGKLNVWLIQLFLGFVNFKLWLITNTNRNNRRFSVPIYEYFDE